jgi:hypothetical protein
MTHALIVEADGGSRGNPGPAAFGTVVRDAATGAILAEIAEYLGVVTLPSIAVPSPASHSPTDSTRRPRSRSASIPS